jgi:hypothetical protein
VASEAPSPSSPKRSISFAAFNSAFAVSRNSVADRVG